MTNADQVLAFQMMIPNLNKDVLSALMTLAKANHSTATTKFNFTPDQLADLAQSREDIKQGRVFTIDEAEARTDAFLASL
jgi:hypothetical protein